MTRNLRFRFMLFFSIRTKEILQRLFDFLHSFSFLVDKKSFKAEFFFENSKNIKKVFFSLFFLLSLMRCWLDIVSPLLSLPIGLSARTTRIFVHPIYVRHVFISINDQIRMQFPVHIFQSFSF
jgi:hypothetical protein